MTRLQVEDVIHIVSPRCDRSSSPICDDTTPAVVLQAGSIPSKVIEAAPVPPILPSTVAIAAPIHILEPPLPRFFTTNGPRVLDVKDLSVIRFLGEGTSGKVYFVKDRISKAKLALKVVPKAGKSEYTLNVLVEERELMEKLSDSPWFVNLWGSWHDSANLYIAMVGRHFYSSTLFRAHVQQLSQTAYPTDLDSEMIRCEKIEPARARFYMAEIVRLFPVVFHESSRF